MSSPFRWNAWLLAALQLVIPSFSAGALGAESAQPVLDVKLTAEGGLHGELLDPGGRPLTDAEVTIRRGFGPTIHARTDSRGRFAARLPAGGLYQVEGGGAAVPCRVWTAPAAPPTARPELLLIGDSEVVRGRRGRRGLGPLINTALGVGLILAPILINARGNDVPAGS